MGNKKEKQFGASLKAVIFDIDGTLVDSNNLHVESWIEAFKRFGKNLEFDEVHRQMGKGGDQLMPVFCSEAELESFGSELENCRIDIFTNEYLPRVKPFPKVEELFRKIKDRGLRIALASSATEEEMERHKKNLGIKEFVETSTSADDAEKSKPAPDIFQAALVRLKDIKPEEAVVVGDTPYDAIAASKAGIQTVGLLSGGFTEDELKNAGAVEIYRDVADLLERFDDSLISKTQAKVVENQASTEA